jgi:hypothetical protein
MKVYANDNKSLALVRSVRWYCKGEDQNVCIRKMVSKQLGGPANNQNNLMPTGAPLSGTTAEAVRKMSESIKNANMQKQA